ncbi:alpha/beta fold hydrolase [Sphingomonas lacunae]|uniref:Alpha/beta fold hydrolase n=1 Tax=Sphingomonas lacunae TaxID=2698828 RepID=A0A6M4AWK3_9SPHN|nr:alpha/beta fold hydrolase [Sphingomonas lacunae]QJQ31361.1 alpha/beta fold hydrolase [Sphingomonas lacunae]
MKSFNLKGYGGVRLEADMRGPDDAPPVLIVHGAGQTRQDWDDVACALELAGRRVISFDMRGHGQSEWPASGYLLDQFVEDLKAVLASLDARPVIVAATLGGWLAMLALGEEGAHLAAGLVLVDTPPGPDGERAAEVGASLRRVADSAREPRWDAALLDQLGSSAIQQRLMAAAPRLSLPVLSLKGTKSGLVEGPSADDMLAAIPGVELVEVEGAVHSSASERLETFNAVLLDFLERRCPLTPPEYREGSDARTFRDALGCFATGVTIVTAMDGDGNPVGLTANSFTSVSLDPPLLLVCIANNAGSRPVLESAERFAVNVLQIGQQPTSNRFAGRGEDRFASTPWQVGEFGTPVLTGSLASFECGRHALYEGGDHIILVGKVMKAMFEPQRDPLLYFRGKYRRLHFA